jgi:UDP-N-acetylmuramyl tripeptide synthase
MYSVSMSFAVFAAKTVNFLSKLLGNKGSSMPGKVARTLCPDILTKLSKQIRNEIIVVTGTNGKTTTNNILRDILKVSGFKVVCNDVGANMINGVTTSFVLSANIFGKLNSDFACVETDEASLQKVVDELTPNKIIITNLFRDQLDRYGEIDITINYINNALNKLKDKNISLILNADDPLTAQFKFKHDFKTYFYGINEDKVNMQGEESREGRFCTFCGQELIYNNYFYSQIGDYYCSKCGFKRPERNFAASNVEIQDSISFNLEYSNKTEPIILNYTGFYNAYNCLGAIAAAISVGASIDNIKKALSVYKPQIGRMERFNLGKPVILNLSKNPAGFNQAINTVANDKRNKNVLVIINDNAQDGKDVSWLWDCDFEKFTCEKINKYYVSGIRKEDMAIRLKYADIKENKIFIEQDIKKAIMNMLEDDVEIIYILVNYTALFDTQNILKDLEAVYGTDVRK